MDLNPQSGNYQTVAGDRGKLIVANGSAAQTITLDSVATPTDGAFSIENANTGATVAARTVTLTPSSGTIDAAASLATFPGWIGTVAFDGTNWVSKTLRGHSLLAPMAIGTDLAAPAAGALLFGMEVAGPGSLVLPRTRSPIDLAMFLEMSSLFGRQSYSYPVGNNSITVSTVGDAITAIGTATASAGYATTNRYTKAMKTDYTSAAAINSEAGRRGAQNRLSVPAGFLAVWHFGFNTIAAGNRLLVGIMNGNGMGAGEPSALAVDQITFGADAADTQIQLMYGVGAGGRTKVALGASFPWPATALVDWFEAVMYAPDGGANLYYRLTNLQTAAVVSGSVAAASLPTAFIKYVVEQGTGSSAAACVFSTGHEKFLTLA